MLGLVSFCGMYTLCTYRTHWGRVFSEVFTEVLLSKICNKIWEKTCFILLKVFKYDFMRNSTPMCRTSTVHTGSSKKLRSLEETEVCYVMKEQSTAQQIFRHPKSTQTNNRLLWHISYIRVPLALLCTYLYVKLMKQRWTLCLLFKLLRLIRNSKENFNYILWKQKWMNFLLFKKRIHRISYYVVNSKPKK